MNGTSETMEIEADAPAATGSDLAEPKRRRRTKGPSERIRLLAALSLAPKIGYIKISDLIEPEEREAEAWVRDRLPRLIFKAGDAIHPTESREPMLFIVRMGAVNVFRPSTSGRRLLVKRLDAGTLFGEMPQIGQTMLGAHVEAAEPAEIAVVSSQDFDQIAKRAPTIWYNLVRKIGPRLVEAERRHEQAAFQPVTARLASLLLRIAGHGNQVMGYSHQEMADVLGVYRETVTNAIAELKQDGLIRVGRKRITLLDIPGLRKLDSI
jgi:CRP-like cAMP-binding protein